MRALVHDAVADAREMVGDLVRDLRESNTFTEDEQLRRYERLHKGRPLATLQFAEQAVGPGPHVLDEALRYEARMEEAWAKRKR